MFGSDADTMGILSNHGLYQAQNRKAPLVTVSILHAFLSDFAILQSPKKSTRRFTWFKVIQDESDLDNLNPEEVDSSHLFICPACRTERLLSIAPLAFVLAISRSSDIPEWAGRYRNSIMLVKSSDGLMYFSSLIQNLFTGILIWESKLDNVVASHGTIADLLEEGSRALGCYMAVTDAGYNDIAHTASVKPPAGELVNFEQTGCYSPRMISHIETNVLPEYQRTKAPVVDSGSAPGEPRLIHYPIYYNGDYFFHLVMAYNPSIELAAACDLFVFFANRFSALCATFWDELILLNSPWHRILTNLIDGVPMNEQYEKEQLAMMNIPENHLFCLLCFDLDSNYSPTKRSRINDVVSQLNNGDCFPFAYNGRLLVLCHVDRDAMRHFSVQELAADIDRHGPSIDALRVGISDPFVDLNRIGTAVAQAMIAINLSPVVDAACAFCCQKRSHYCYTFSSVLPYYQMLVYLRDDNLMLGGSRNGILSVLAREDAEMGTDIVRLLWTYLSQERNATAASKQLHMHRNTVLYHIEKIERRFSITLDDIVTRMSLLNEFRVFFLTDGFTHDIDFDKYMIVRHITERTIV